MSSELARDGLLKRELRSLLTAAQYFTRIPVPTWVGHSAAQLERASRYFPLIGLGVGAIGAAAFWLGSLLFPPFIAATLSTLATLAVTGAFHEDGLADTIDGLGGGVTRERALEIMKDSRVGAFGVLALLLVILLKVSALAAMSLRDGVLALMAGHALSRGCAVLLIAGLPYARSDDSTRAKPVVEHVRRLDFAIACLCSIAPLVLLWPRVVLSLGVVLITLAMLFRWFKRRLGGYTGDTLGATQQCCEVAFYLSLVASWKSF